MFFRCLPVDDRRALANAAAGESKCFLSEDPRRNPQALTYLTSTFEGMLSRPADSNVPDVLVPKMSAMASESMTGGNNRGLEEARGNMTLDHAREVFRVSESRASLEQGRLQLTPSCSIAMSWFGLAHGGKVTPETVAWSGVVERGSPRLGDDALFIARTE